MRKFLPAPRRMASARRYYAEQAAMRHAPRDFEIVAPLFYAQAEYTRIEAFHLIVCATRQIVGSSAFGLSSAQLHLYR